jgi:4-amino-4-deoxy-L-arabinose transferase-like glycosyltransferase
MTSIPLNPQVIAPTADQSTSPRWLLAAGGITLAALVLRLIGINAHSFWYDEAFTAAIINASYGDIYFFRGLGQDAGNPPLYWMLAKAWASLFGTSELAFRSLAVIFGTLSIPVMAWVGLRLFNPAVGLIAAALLAISPLAVELSNEARTYASQGLFIILATALLLRWLETRRVLDLSLYAAVMVLVVYGHYFAFVVPLAHLVGLATLEDRLRILRPWAMAIGVVALLWLPWLPAFFSQLRLGGNLDRMPTSWHLQFIATPLVLSLGRTFAWRDSVPWLLALGLLAAIIGFWIPAAWGLIKARRDKLAFAMLATWLLVPIIPPLLASLAGFKFYHTRAASVTLPALLLFIAVGLYHLRPALRYPFIAIILVFTTVSLARYASQPLKDDWRSASGAMLAAHQADEPILFDTDIEVISFRYYAERAGRVPPGMIGLMSPPTPEGQLPGVFYADGVKMHGDTRDYAARVFESPGIWLAMCVPAGQLDEYRSLFARHGYALAGTHRFHRVDVHHFRKSSSQP